MPIDYSKYPYILDRSGNCCEFCGVANKAGLFSVALQVKVAGGKYKKKRIWVSDQSDYKRLQSIGPFTDMKMVTVVLTVAHLDHDEENHDVSMDRLAALCQWCHLNYDAKEKFRRACSKG